MVTPDFALCQCVFIPPSIQNYINGWYTFIKCPHFYCYCFLLFCSFSHTLLQCLPPASTKGLLRCQNGFLIIGTPSTDYSSLCKLWFLPITTCPQNATRSHSHHFPPSSILVNDLQYWCRTWESGPRNSNEHFWGEGGLYFFRLQCLSGWEVTGSGHSINTHSECGCKAPLFLLLVRVKAS